MQYILNNIVELPSIAIRLFHLRNKGVRYEKRFLIFADDYMGDYIQP